MIGNQCLVIGIQDKMKNSEQLRLLRKLESQFKIMNAGSFGDQVHFQNANKTPVQRWFPYREGFSIKLVDAFLKELKVSGNVFDPFCGSGTTLLASRFNGLTSFGIDINPISALVSSVENNLYYPDDINFLADFINSLNKLEKSSGIYQTNFELAEKVFNYEILQALLQLKTYIASVENLKMKNLSTIWN